LAVISNGLSSAVGAERSATQQGATDAAGRLKVGLRDWVSVDAPAASPPSLWYVSEGVVKLTENTLVNNKKALKPDPTLEREGTMFVYQAGAEFADGELTLDLFATDDDGIGVAFRWNAPDKYYLWYMDGQRRYRTLAVRNDASYAALESNRRGFEMRRWYAVRIVMEGPRIAVYVDGVKEFETRDNRHRRGTIALYCWGNSGAMFRDVRFVAKPAVPAESHGEETDSEKGGN